MNIPTMNPIVFDTVLGINKGLPRSRVWIEGARLVEAGFTVGARYRRFADSHSLRLVLEPSPANPEEFFKVSGKGEKPIIDITGRTITERFHGTHVRVTYTPGEITINNILQ